MKFNNNFIFLSSFDVNPLLKLLATETRWNIYTGRQNKFKVHHATQTIPLIWLPNGFIVGSLTKMWKFPEFYQYILTIDHLIKHLKTHFIPIAL